MKMKNIGVLNNIQYSFATVFWSIIISDNRVSKKEQKKFNIFLENEFSLNQIEQESMFEKVQESTNETINEHLEILKEVLCDYPVEKSRFMRYINECIICDGIEDREYETFEEIKEKLF